MNSEIFLQVRVRDKSDLHKASMSYTKYKCHNDLQTFFCNVISYYFACLQRDQIFVNWLKAYGRRDGRIFYIRNLFYFGYFFAADTTIFITKTCKFILFSVVWHFTYITCCRPRKNSLLPKRTLINCKKWQLTLKPDLRQQVLR